MHALSRATVFLVFRRILVLLHIMNVNFSCTSYYYAERVCANYTNKNLPVVEKKLSRYVTDLFIHIFHPSFKKGKEREI